MSDDIPQHAPRGALGQSREPRNLAAFESAANQRFLEQCLGRQTPLQGRPFAKVMRKSRYKAAGAGAILCLAAFGFGQAVAAGDGTLELSMEGGLVNLRIGEPTPASDVVDRLAALFSADIEGDTGPGIVKPVSVDRTTLAAILELVLPRRSFVVETSETGQVRRIVIMEERTAGRSVSAIAPVGGLLEKRLNAHDVGSANRLAMIEIVKLSYQPDGSSLMKLKEIAQRNGDTSVRIAAIRALAGHVEHGALSFLANRLVADPEPDIRLAAAEAIAQANTSASRSVVARAAVFEKDPRVRKRLQALMDLRPGHNPQ